MPFQQTKVKTNMRHLAILITAVALSLTACLDSSNTHPEVALDDWGDPAELGQIAYATAEALTSSDVRANVLSAMRASVRVEHSLLLGDYLVSVDGADLLNHSARALKLTENEFHQKVLTLPVLELVVPIRDHRLDWTGSPHIGVAGSLDSDAMEFTVYGPSGMTRNAVGIPQLREYDAFFQIRPQEGFGTRIGRQADVPGRVIQDPDDGEQAVIVTVTMDDGEPRSVDYGQFRDDLELQSALADLVDGSAGGGSGGGGLADFGVDDDCDLMFGDSCGGGGGGGQGWSEDPTYLEYWGGFCHIIGGDGAGNSEVEVRLAFNPRKGSKQQGVVRRNLPTILGHEAAWA